MGDGLGLYWNFHPFQSGLRRKMCPYRALELPTYDFWIVLQSAPPDLTQELVNFSNSCVRQPPEVKQSHCTCPLPPLILR